MSICIIITEEAPFNGIVAKAKDLGEVTAFVVGSQNLANKVAKSGVSSVKFVETNLTETNADIVANAIKDISPKLVLTSSAPGARTIAGAVSKVLNGVIIQGLTNVTLGEDSIVAEQEALGGRVLETLESKNSVIGYFVGEDVELEESNAVEITTLDGSSYAMSVEISSENAATSGLVDASRVVSLGRGVKSKDDLELIESFAKAMNAEIGCSMPVADDLNWLPKDCYVGRSGQKISPKVYFAVGISGAPQHLEGVRGAKIIVAINNDPEARIFKSADYGIVGDLYEIIPALKEALN